MKFSEFFTRWAHENYYAKGVKIGKNGDFYTSVSAGFLFGAAWANYFLKQLDAGVFSPSATIAEIGANDGSMTADFIQAIFTLRPEIFGKLKFAVIEPHENLRRIQQETFTTRLGGATEILELSSLDELARLNPREIFVMSNELLDSFACEVLNERNMLFIGKNFKPFWSPADDEILAEASGAGLQRGELAIGVRKFAKDLAAVCDRVKFCSFDYGEWERRQNFSLRIYKNHRVFDFFGVENLGEFFGASDLTYDVCFKDLARNFEAEGFKTNAFRKQNSALIEIFGAQEIVEIIADKGGEAAKKDAIKQLNFLINPHFLGERFKFIEFSNF